MAVVDDLQIAAAGHEDHAQARLADAVHGIERDAQLRVLDGLHVNGGQDAVDIFIRRVVLGDHACRDGEIAGAAIDVTEQEPLPAGSPLRTLNNLIITPHIAWYTEEAIATLKEKLAQEIIRVYEGGQPVNIVNRNSLKGMETK